MAAKQCSRQQKSGHRTNGNKRRNCHKVTFRSSLAANGNTESTSLNQTSDFALSPNSTIRSIGRSGQTVIKMKKLNNDNEDKKNFVCQLSHCSADEEVCRQ